MNIVQRIKEPSTWAGLGILALSLGLDPKIVAALGHVASALVPFVPVDGGVLAHMVTAVAAGTAVILPESKPAAGEGA